MTNTIEATITVRHEHKEEVEELFASTGIETDAIEGEALESTVFLDVNGVGSQSDMRLEVVLDYLRQNNISYSYIWREMGTGQGGEVHYRSNGKAVQYLSWMDYEKNVVDIEEVRQAVAQGDTAVMELLEVTENRFTPWDWSEVAA